MDRLDRNDLRNASFDVAMRGYDKRQVDERIRLLGGELAAAEHALRATQARAASLEAELKQLRSGAGGAPGGGAGGRADSHFGARVEKILLTAEQEAREIRSQAGAEATALLEQARAESKELRTRAAKELATQQAEAEKISKAATQEADQLRHAAGQEAEQLRTVAAKEAEEVRKAARGQAGQLVEQARIEADRLVSSATESSGQRERACAQEMQRLSRLRDQVNAELYRAKNLLDGFFPAMAKGVREQRDQAAVAEPQSSDAPTSAAQSNNSVRR